MWNKRILGSLVALALVLAACGTGEPSASASGQPLAADQVFRFGSPEPQTMDPQQAYDTTSVAFLHQVSRPLLWFTKDLELTADGGLAADLPTISDDGLTLTFTLKPGLKFSDASPITADNFVAAFRRLADPRIAAAYQYLMSDVAGGNDVLAMALDDLPPDAEVDAALDKLGLTAVDDTTLEIKLSRAAGYFPYIAAMWVASPVKVDAVAADFAEAAGYVSSGPFKLTGWEHDASMAMERNENWVGEPAGLTSIKVTIQAKTSQAYDSYLNDELDMATVPTQHAAEVRADPDLTAQSTEGDVLCTYYLGFDMTGTPDKPTKIIGQSKALRHALSQSVDRTALVETINQGVGTVWTSMVSKGMAGADPDAGLAYDVVQAKADLEIALDELKLTVADLSEGGKAQIELGYNKDAGHEPIMEFLQAQWKENLGITVALTSLEWNAYLDRIHSEAEQFTIHRLGWCADYPHPNDFLRDVWYTGSGNNGAKYSNPAFDKLVDDAAVTPELADQLPIYKEAQELLVDDAPALFLYSYGSFGVTKPWVLGLIPTAGDGTRGEYFFDKITIAAHE